MDSARALVAKGRGIVMVSRTMGVSRAQLSLRINRSADWQDRRCNRRNEEADAEILSAILNIISDMPSYGYRRVWGILRKQRRTEGQPPVNAKRLYRIMSEHNLLLLHHKPERPKREQALLQRLAAVRGRLSLCADQAAAAKWWLSMPMASVSAEGPMPKALSTRRTSPLMPGCRHQGRACPLRRARMTSNPLIVA